MTTTSLLSGVSPYQEIHDDGSAALQSDIRQKVQRGCNLGRSQREVLPLTVAHLFKGSENNCLGLEVSQPSYEDYLNLVAHAQHAKRICQRHVERLETGDEEILLKLQTATTRVDQLLDTSHDTPESYHDSDMKVARVVKSGYKKMLYNARPCLLDYALCKLETRKPKQGDQFYDPLPPPGYLRSIDWATDATEIGTLMYDKYVMKRGRSTGVTYGIVAGVYSMMRHSNTDVRREFWVIPEDKSTTLWQFTEKGHSGALVRTSDGRLLAWS